MDFTDIFERVLCVIFLAGCIAVVTLLVVVIVRLIQGATLC